MAEVSFDEAGCVLSGPLNNQSIPSFWTSFAPMCEHSLPPTISLKGVTDVDSATLALLLKLKRLAKAAHKTIEFNDMPPQLEHLAQLSGVVALI